MKKLRTMFRKVLFILSFVVAMLGGNWADAQINNVRLLDYKVVAVNPLTLDVVVKVTAHNDTVDLMLDEVFCVAYKDGAGAFLAARANAIDLPKGTSKHRIKIKVDRAEGVSLKELVESALHFDAGLYSADLRVDLRWPDNRVESKSRQGIRLRDDGKIGRY